MSLDLIRPGVDPVQGKVSHGGTPTLKNFLQTKNRIHSNDLKACWISKACWKSVIVFAWFLSDFKVLIRFLSYILAYFHANFIDFLCSNVLAYIYFLLNSMFIETDR